MESANLHHQHHQLQEQLVAGSPSLATPSFYGVGSNSHAWNSNLLNDGSFNQNIGGVLANSRDLRQNSDTLISSSVNNSMFQDLGFHWDSNASGSFTNHSSHQPHLAKIKELSDSFPKLSQTVSNVEEFHLPSTSYVKNEQQSCHNPTDKMLLKTLASGCQNNTLQHSAGESYADAQSCASTSSFGGLPPPSSGGRNFSQIFPSINISNMYSSSLPFSSSLGVNLQALDFLSSTKFGGSLTQQPSPSHLGMLRDSLSFGVDQLQQSSLIRSFNSPNKVSSFTNRVTETKKPSNSSEPKVSQAATKKPRFESRSSFPPFKVRKEKLGDRIAALQQLVSPFGKTDTASVLMEAIGYIKFLQDQVEGSGDGDRNDEQKQDLRSRGLCLVPLSCTSYFTNDAGGVWPPPNFGGGT
ncbi:PREDICTED: transcription factor bHLH110-like isoform X2 [Nelumbo nucifera]|uniref:Transcription factor bHLH110-like isoform X2 n=1 Tax=Nelumbo nucifera TaxID=4432 RepID=A0A1U8AA27_NELNU|nr:PREDICTED: transcription factor bHLH110-like isoform X2 [Nelumbo nucifera]